MFQMDVRNLAIIFGPTLLQPRVDNIIGMVKDMSSQCQIVEAIVLHVSLIFSAKLKILVMYTYICLILVK